jgi:hypothetical protein
MRGDGFALPSVLDLLIVPAGSEVQVQDVTLLATIGGTHFCQAVAKVAAKPVGTAEFGNPFVFGCRVGGLNIALHGTRHGAGRASRIGLCRERVVGGVLGAFGACRAFVLGPAWWRSRRMDGFGRLLFRNCMLDVI